MFGLPDPVSESHFRQKVDIAQRCCQPSMLVLNRVVVVSIKLRYLVMVMFDFVDFSLRRPTVKKQLRSVEPMLFAVCCQILSHRLVVTHCHTDHVVVGLLCK